MLPLSHRRPGGVHGFGGLSPGHKGAALTYPSQPVSTNSRFSCRIQSARDTLIRSLIRSLHSALACGIGTRGRSCVRCYCVSSRGPSIPRPAIRHDTSTSTAALNAVQVPGSSRITTRTVSAIARRSSVIHRLHIDLCRGLLAPLGPLGYAVEARGCIGCCSRSAIQARIADSRHALRLLAIRMGAGNVLSCTLR